MKIKYIEYFEIIHRDSTTAFMADIDTEFVYADHDCVFDPGMSQKMIFSGVHFIIMRIENDMDSRIKLVYMDRV